MGKRKKRWWEDERRVGQKVSREGSAIKEEEVEIRSLGRSNEERGRESCREVSEKGERL